MIKFELESAVSAAYKAAVTKQYRRAVANVAGTIAEMRGMSYLYSENDVRNFKTGAVLGLLWMVDEVSGKDIEHDIDIAVANIEVIPG